MALATADQLKTFNQRIANGHTGQKYMNKNNFYVGSSADNATAANKNQLNEYYKRVRAGHDGQKYLTNNNIYIGNRGTTTPTTTTNTTSSTTPGGMNQDYYDMVYGYEIPKQDTSYQNTYRQDMNNINYNPAQIQDSWSNNYNNALNNINYDNSNVKQTYNNALGNVDYNTAKINEDYYNRYRNDLANISGLANVDTLYDWRRNQATDAAQKYMASLGLSGSGAEAQAVTDAVNKVTSEDARRYEELYMQEAQRRTEAANQLANQGYNLYGTNAGYENDMNKLRTQNQSQAARDLAGYDNEMNQLRLQNQFNAANNLLNADITKATKNADLAGQADQTRWAGEQNMARDIAGFNQTAASNYQNLSSQKLFNNSDRYYNMTEAERDRELRERELYLNSLLQRLNLWGNLGVQGADMGRQGMQTDAAIRQALAGFR